jgi:hypothetical protein
LKRPGRFNLIAARGPRSAATTRIVKVAMRIAPPIVEDGGKIAIPDSVGTIVNRP